MKTIFLLLLCILLTGCAPKEAPPETTLSSTTAAPETAAPTTVPESEAAEALPKPANEAIVRVQDYIPTIAVELKYATTDNFTGQVIYDFQDAYLRYGTVKKLAAVQTFLQMQGLSLKIWDAYRPVSAQYALWEAYPDPSFVADPNRTHSSHSRGNTLDVTIIDSTGAELEMPTGFDDFSQLADRDYSDCDFAIAENARLLQSIMEQRGFTGYQKEWWHFSDNTQYDVVN